TEDGRTLSLLRGAWHVGSVPPSAPVLDNLSCPTATFCMGLVDGSSVRVLRGGSWSTVALPTGSWGTPTCTSATFCMALGDTQGAVWDGSPWSTVARPSLSATLFDCATSTSCVVVSDTSDTEVWNGTTWTPEGTNTSFPASLSCAAPDDCWAGTEESSVT